MEEIKKDEFPFLSEKQIKSINESIKKNIPVIINLPQEIKGKTSLKRKIISLGGIAYENWEVNMLSSVKS